MNKIYQLIIFLLFGYALKPVKAQNTGSLILPRMFSNNMVLQQDIHVPVWGICKPQQAVQVNIAGTKVQTKAGADGKWLVHLQPHYAGGPYELIVQTSDEKRAITNVMIGEVWLASGQSNMNYRLKDARGEALSKADYPNIREFHVPENVNQLPQSNLAGGEWKVCTPANAGDFSAVAYAFARELHLDKKVAVGIIHASRGGTPIETWLSADVLLSHPDYRAHILKVASTPENWVQNQRMYDSLGNVRAKIIQRANGGLKLHVNSGTYRDEDSWKTATYPIMANKTGASPYSFIWFRKTVEIPQGANLQDMTLKLGTIQSGGDITYFNGVELGRGTMQGIRTFKVPAKLIKPGKNLIAIRLISEWASGKLGKEPDEPQLVSADGNVAISLKSEWRYNTGIEPELPYFKSYNKEPAIFFNAVINPLIPYGIRGVLWYQGENNAYDHDPLQYKTLLPLLLADWRTRWGQGYMPFLFVQLPNFKFATNWPLIREAQLGVLNYPATGLAVAIDSGDPDDVHPANKTIVGKRLYLAAKNVAYHDKLIYSGPIYNSSQIAGDSVIISFKHAEGGLATKNALSGFVIAGADKQFYPAVAIIRGNQIIVRNTTKVPKPMAVRYLWEQDPKASIYNAEGLPASPFRTDNW